MPGSDVIHPLEGMWAPLEVRSELRQSFGRWLRSTHNSSLCSDGDATLDEHCLLVISQHYRLEFTGGRTDISEVWDNSAARKLDGGPSFEDLKRLGWIMYDGGRWVMPHIPRGTNSSIGFPSPSTEAFLLGLNKLQLVPKTDKRSVDTELLAAKISDKIDQGRYISIANPEIFLSRLWKKLSPLPLLASENAEGHSDDLPDYDSFEPDDFIALGNIFGEEAFKAFLEWAAWCHLINGFAKWDLNWSPVEMYFFRVAAYCVLERQNLWNDWKNDIEREISVIENTFALPKDQPGIIWLPNEMPPGTSVARIQWLAGSSVEHFMMERLIRQSRDSCTVNLAFSALCSELEVTDIGPGIPDKISALFSFTIDHPMALQHFILRLNRGPVLLVDMLMYPPSACLASRLIIEWPSQERSRDRNVGRDAQTKAFAVEDALSLLAHHLKKETLDLQEYASLITWCYIEGATSGRAKEESRSLVGRRLLVLLSGEGEAVQCAVLKHMIELAAFQNNVPRACFKGVLEGLNLLTRVESVDCSPLVALYLKFASDRNLDWTDAAGLPPELAVRLVATALKLDETHGAALLIPFNSVKLLREASEKEKHSISYQIAKTLRTHVRLLARAISGWPDETAPSKLSDAFRVLISRSVIEHQEKGRIGALTDRYGHHHFFMGREDGSPARDLADAWQKLDSTVQNKILQLLLQSDDPVLLADLSQYLPAGVKSDLQERLLELIPGEASDTWTWPEFQHRIQSLLAAGECNLAREHLYQNRAVLEQAPAQFRLGLFGLELQLLMKERNWSALDDMVVPSIMEGISAQQAQENLDFYKATSQLLRPDGNLAFAQTVLRRLAAKPGAATAYKENLFAVELQKLLGTELRPLDDENLAAGEDLLTEINAAISANDNSAGNNLFANRALLLLSLKRPKDALSSLELRRVEKPGPDLEHIATLAYYELGFKVEAIATLDKAIANYGDTDQLVALKKDLLTGRDISSVASVSASVEADVLSSIQVAMQRLSELPPSQVGVLFDPSGTGLRGYLTKMVSRAVATLSHMSAMLRSTKDPENDVKLENDLNTAVREVLSASLYIVKWNVSDQSLGGHTVTGNPGERDCVIRTSSQEIAIFEALVCSGLHKKKIKDHFDKLIGYGVCDIYFLVIYSYANEVLPLLNYLKQMLEDEAPKDMNLRGYVPVGPPDYEVSGYSATYRVDHREVAVVFMIVDLKIRIPDKD